LRERIDSGEITHLYCYDWDRLFRGDKSDEQTIEDAFCSQGLTVVTRTETFVFSEDY
jgi:hypothetical protein